jgi:hypothetical protein
MSHIHEPPTIIREETRETDSGASMGMGMVFGVIMVIVLAMAMFWFVAGARVFGTTTNPNSGTTDKPPTINIAPPSINIDKPNVEINPPAVNPPQNPQPTAPGSGGQ